MNTHTVKPPKRKPETNEWVVRWFTNGKPVESNHYYTDDKADAIDTFKVMEATATIWNNRDNSQWRKSIEECNGDVASNVAERMEERMLRRVQT